jgi:solute carrier family 35 (adenosine 3'-phospho 5'-phosphosulfate transporter), member B3
MNSVMPIFLCMLVISHEIAPTESPPSVESGQKKQPPIHSDRNEECKDSLGCDTLERLCPCSDVFDSNSKIYKMFKQIGGESCFGLNMASPKNQTNLLHSCEVSHSSEAILILGFNISGQSRIRQFWICATGVFVFSLLYGYLQELISVHVLDRKLGLFLSVVQFTSYTLWSYLLRSYVCSLDTKQLKTTTHGTLQSKPYIAVPFLTYLGLSLLRAVDLGMTNMAMQYVNYPAKTLMKSSRVVFTMIFGVLVANKSYRPWDFFIVLMMVIGLVVFMHADATSSAVFNSIGIIMLTVSLACDGALSNFSETVMTKYKVGHDEFIFNMYIIALLAITFAAYVQGDLAKGIHFMSVPGTYSEMDLLMDERTWSKSGKWLIIFLFSTTGFLGSSCSAAITKHFGALSMSITSTARKATTLFLSFALFHNVCSLEHIVGITIFIAALAGKSMSKKSRKAPSPQHSFINNKNNTNDTETLSLIPQAVPVRPQLKLLIV